MAETSIAHPAHESIPEFWKGRGLFETYRDELKYVGSGKWLIPSGSECGKVYEVRVGIRRESRCECAGHRHHGHCSHVVCAERVHRLSGTCDCCGERRYWPRLRAVEEDDALLSWYPGDVICEACVREGAWA
ncbi:MAG: hypothetical protein M3315_04815 [Actinomycetota bacterium]|nr:hypothetical protein [Actinomycetota bacterium]